MSKLTLSVDEDVVHRAKRYAAARGTSVSQIVERYLDALARPPVTADEDLLPALRRLRGLLRGVGQDRQDYLDALDRKYR